MRNILDELYEYDLLHLTEVDDTDEAYRATLDRLIKVEIELKRRTPTSTKFLPSINRRILTCTLFPIGMNSARASGSERSLSLGA